MNHESISKWLARSRRPNGFAEIPEMNAWIGTSLGEVRRENQDRAVIARFTSTTRPEKAFTCFVLGDGMGGMEDGARCAEIALSAFIVDLVQDQSLVATSAAVRAANAANTAVHRNYRERGGTTLAAIVLFGRSASAVTVGDSRIYEIGDGKKLHQVSTDDTIEGELNRLIGRNPSLAKSDTFAGQLAQYIGIGEGLEPRTYAVNRSSPYLLTTDGIHGYDMSPKTLAQVVTATGSGQVLIRNLLQLSRMCGGVDNATAIFVPPLPPEWAAPPPYVDGDWLELWDAFGKVEFGGNRHSMPVQKGTPLGAFSQKQPEKLPKTGKRSSPRKKEAVAEHESKRVSPAQGRLTIEIVDENAREASISQAETLKSPETFEAVPAVEERAPGTSITATDSTPDAIPPSALELSEPAENTAVGQDASTEKAATTDQMPSAVESPTASENPASPIENDASKRE